MASKYTGFHYSAFYTKDLDKFIEELTVIRNKATKKGYKKVRVHALYMMGACLNFEVLNEKER
ncbi:MAG TPA: hypothetical protein VKR58_06085 [Aquella sp.]|nr:hypothetical protein [Aquella sp.]